MKDEKSCKRDFGKTFKKLDIYGEKITFTY